jgi:hypothetical protein
MVIILLLNYEDFLIGEEDVFVPVLDVPLEETLCSCPSDFHQSRSKEVSLLAGVRSLVYIDPDEARLDLVDK